MSLWKQIERGDGIDDVSAGDQFLQIAREGGGIAGDVRDLCRVKIQNAFDHCRLGARARRIEQDEVDWTSCWRHRETSLSQSQ